MNNNTFKYGALAVGLLAGIATGDAFAAQHFYAKLGGTTIMANAKSGELNLGQPNEFASLAVSAGPVAGSGAELSDESFPSVILGYRLPWGGGRLSVETILAAPISFTFSANEVLAEQSLAPTAFDDVPTGIAPLGRQMGETKMLPPTTTLVFRPLLGRIQPYLGAGVTYLYSFDSEITNPSLTEVYTPELKIDDRFSYVLQAGLDLSFSRNLFLNADFKYIGKAELNARISDIAINDDIGLWQAEIAGANLPITLEPYVLSVNLGWRFSL